MARLRSSPSSRQTRDGARLVTLARALNSSGSRVEDRYWEGLIEQILLKLLRTNNDTPLETALNQLAMEETPGAYEALIEQAETLSESSIIEHDGKRYEALLIVAPVVAWTRYSIPAGPIAAAHMQAIVAQMHGHILAADTKLALLPHLVSVEQMPRSFAETAQWLQRLALQALDLGKTRPVLPDDAEVANMLADTRYIVGVALAEQGKPLFRWQETPGDDNTDRAACQAQWASQIQPTIAQLLPGCGFECLLPDAYYVSNREADRRVRPLMLRAGIAWLESALNLPASQFRAVLAACGEERAEEYRIGLTTRQSNDVIHGCIWPLYDRESITDIQGDDLYDQEPFGEIIEQLKSLGVTDIRRLPGLLPPEFCEDCGTPYFPNPLGEMVHAALPEDIDGGPAHFH